MVTKSTFQKAQARKRKRAQERIEKEKEGRHKFHSKKNEKLLNYSKRK